MKTRKTPIRCGVAVAALVAAAAIPAANTSSDAHRPFFSRIAPPNVAETLATSSRKAADADGFPSLGVGRVRVVVESGAPADARRVIEAAGGTVERSWRNLVQADLPRSAVPALRRRASVEAVRAPMRMFLDAVGGEEVAASLAPAWHAKGFTGKGVKVAIIDGGFIGLADRQAQGDLPASLVTRDICGGRFNTETEHGTAVAEIVHEMAPEAQLYLICVDTEVDLAAAAAFAKVEGAHVISHSAGWFGEMRGDGSGPIGAIVADARAAGILWVNSAGNSAQTHWSGTYVSADGDRVHDWAPGDEGNTFVWPNDTEICGFLRWDEWSGGASDFDLVLFHSATGTLLAASDDVQGGDKPPVEGLCVGQRSGTDLTVAWGIEAYSVKSAPRMDLFVFDEPLQYQTPAGSLAEPATSAAALSVGALCWQTRQPEFFTSQGPTIDGRVKPDIAGHDSVSGATYGGFTGCAESAFAGTSAAAPEVSGAAALVKQAFPKFGPDQLQQYLLKSARDMAAAGMDNVTGAGELQLPKAPDVVPPTSRALASTGRAGKTVKLLSAIADNEGAVSVVEQVKRNGKAVRTIRRPGSVVATSPRTVTTPWTAPAKPKGTFQHCAVAVDAAGNRSPQSCARIVLR
jgi:subtilisin family serine protease